MREIRYFLMISLEIKYDHQGIRIGCEFRALWGEEGVQIHSVREIKIMITKGENMCY